MGIETDLSTPGIEYSIQGAPWEPYNPALILGGLQTGVTPLEMAHAYNTLEEDGNRISGTMAANSGGPVGILDVHDGGDCVDEGGSDCYQQGDRVPDQTGADGLNEVISKQVIDPSVAQSAKDVLATVVSSGTGERAQTGDPTWGKTGTTDNNGDAWFCGATPKITVCVWVGHPDSVTPMETEFAGAPVDGGTFPAEIFAQVVNAYDDLEAARKAGEDTDIDTTSVPTPEPTTPAPEAPAATPTESVPATSEPATPSAPADSGGGAPASGDGAVAPG
jgi:penicillin-binding protein 1A